MTLTGKTQKKHPGPPTHGTRPAPFTPIPGLQGGR